MPFDGGVDLGDILTRGGEPRVSLLRHCVMSVTLEPVFVFLVREYSLRPTHQSALALYDIFCAPGAPARLNAPEVLPPRDLQIRATVDTIRTQARHLASPASDDSIAITIPPRHLFARVADAVENGDRFAALARRYDPDLTPQQNLPDGRMNKVQRHFMDRLWRPSLRPRLAAAGFWHIANIE